MRPINFCLLFALGFALLGSNGWGQEAQATAAVSSDTVGVQDQFQLTVTVSGKDSGDAENPEVSNLKDFRIVSGPSIGTEFRWINGRTSNIKRFTYILIPEKEGQFTIDPIEVRIGSNIYKTQPLEIRVTSASSSPSPQPQRRFNPLDPFEEERIQRRSAVGDAVFVRGELDRASARPGQQVTLSYKLYTQISINGIQLEENPPISGFWVEDLEVDKKPKGITEVVNGREYQAFTIKKQALFATTTGKLKIPSSIFAISARSAGDFFGIFDRPETVYRKTEELFLEVKPLPDQGRPDDFSNAVGSFKLAADIDKTDAVTGEAVALKVQLKGRGNLKMIPDISLPSLPDFTVYSSKRADAIRPQAGDQIGGSKTWEYVVVPKAPGRHTIPPFSFSFFNPDRNEYETVTTAALNLNVRRSTENAAAFSGLSGSEKQDLIRRGTDVNFIKLSPGSLKIKDAPFYRNLHFFLIAAVPLLFNIGAFVYQKQRSRSNESADAVRSRRAKRRANERLKAADKELRSDARRFYDRAASALSGYLADRFNLAEIELTGDMLERMLSEKAVHREIVEETRACLQECDFGRFVSASGSADKLKALSARIRRNIDALEKAASTGNSVQFDEQRFH
jgi:hypothetical protein